MKRKHIVILVIFILVAFILIRNKNYEGLDATNTPPLSNEAIQSISSVYSNTAGVSTFNNIKATGKITGKLIGDVSGNVMGNVMGNVTGDISGTKLCIGSTCITEKELQQITSNKKWAGFATNSEQLPQIAPLYEGYYKTYVNNSINNPFGIMGNDRWDYIYLYKGWKIQVWAAGDKTGQSATYENKDSELPKLFILESGIKDAVSEYEATWVGY